MGSPSIPGTTSLWCFWLLASDFCRQKWFCGFRIPRSQQCRHSLGTFVSAFLEECRNRFILWSCRKLFLIVCPITQHQVYRQLWEVILLSRYTLQWRSCLFWCTQTPGGYWTSHRHKSYGVLAKWLGYLASHASGNYFALCSRLRGCPWQLEPLRVVPSHVCISEVHLWWHLSWSPN